MFSLASRIFALASVSLVLAQQTSFEEKTGTRSLWIPFQTVPAIPLASIAYNDSSTNATAYVIACPAATPSCSIAPNLTLTEGPSTAKYSISNTNGGYVVVDCTMTGTTSAVCSQYGNANGDVFRGSQSTLSASQISYQAVDITATNNNTASVPATVTITSLPNSTTSSDTSTSKAAATITSGPWALGGAIGAGIVALAAL